MDTYSSVANHVVGDKEFSPRLKSSGNKQLNDKKEVDLTLIKCIELNNKHNA